MKSKRSVLWLLPLFLLGTAHAQSILSAEFLGNISKDALQLQFFQPFHCGADRYRVTYETTDVSGAPTVASGLVCLPDNLQFKYPLACYMHGTSSTNDEVPSNLGLDADIAVALCGKGYVSFAPDYLGLGVSQGVHPYVHAASEAWAGTDLMKATSAFAAQAGVGLNGQLFLTGYSQGGHAAMAMHRMVDQELGGAFTVTAAAPMSGPYSIGDVMRALILSGAEYDRPGYLVNTIISYQYVYGDLFAGFEDAFRPEYLPVVEEYWQDAIGLGEMNDMLTDLLIANEGSVIPLKVLRDDFIQAVSDLPDHPANQRMSENDTYTWAPSAPTRLLYCAADEQVPYENSTLAASAMTAAGATDVQAVNISSFSNHLTCAFLAVPTMINFFSQYQQLEPLVGVLEASDTPLSVRPNPVREEVRVSGISGPGILQLYDATGRCVLTRSVTDAGTETLALGNLVPGYYWLRISSHPATVLPLVVAR
ncbi:MAG: hypothetical protein RLY31_3203 [Bacteroidota bacterium]